MSDIITLLSIFLNIVLVLCLVFLKSYVSEKGKNLATKEDIAEIKKITQRIDSEFDVYTQSKVSMVAEERNALIDCYEKLSNYYNLLLDINITVSSVNIDEKYDYETLLSRLEEEFFKSNLSSDKMKLFTQDSDVVNATNAFLRKLLDLRGKIQEIIFKIVTLKVDTNYKNLEKQADTVSIIKTHQDELIKIIRELGTIRMEALAELLPLQEKLISSIRTRFARLANAD